MKKIHLLILKYLSEGQGTVGTLFGDTGTAEGNFYILPILY